jgi:SAM-dependent methyltransferase
MSGITLDDPAAYFAQLAAFESSHWWSAVLWQIAGYWLDASLKGRTGLHSLDVGCGAGLTLDRLAARPEIGSVIGLDPSPEALRYAQGRGHRVVEGSALELPFDPGSFDVVTCFDVIQHLPPDGAEVAAREIARVLRPGGTAIVRTNAGGREGCSIAGLRRVFSTEGLSVVQASHVNATGSLAQEIRGRLMPSRFRPHPEGGGLPAARTRQGTDRAMTWIGACEALLVGRLGWSLPMGHSVMLLATRA